MMHLNAGKYKKNGWPSLKVILKIYHYHWYSNAMVQLKLLTSRENSLQSIHNKAEVTHWFTTKSSSISTKREWIVVS